MNLLVDVTLRSSAVLVIGLVAVALLRRGSAALRHCVLAGAVVMAGLVVPLYLTVPVWTISAPAAIAFPTSLATDEFPMGLATRAGAAEPGRGSVMAPLLVGVWAIGFGTCAVVLVLSLGRVRRIASRAVPVMDGPWSRTAREVADSVGLRRPIVLLETDTPDWLATWGVFRPRILLPVQAREWTQARIHAVLSHEVAHIQRADWLVQLTAEGLRAIYWFNPLFWLACRRLRHESEYACDDAVLRAGVAPRTYAVHLLEVARSCRSSALPVAAVVTMARPSTLERRITAMLNPNLGRQVPSRRAIAVIVVGLLGFALPTAAFRTALDGPLPLAGTVYDPTGAVIPEAALTLEDERQNKWQATSDSAGRFEFAPVGAGRYVLGATLPGFRPLRQELDLTAARDWIRAVTLQVGAVQETITVREQRIKTPRRESQPAGAVPVRVGGDIRPPTKTHDVRPVYPTSMREAGREGRVPLEAIIGRDGTVLSVRVATAQVHPDFAQAAIDAVQQWRFTPTMLNGKPVEVVMTVAVEFQLED